MQSYAVGTRVAAGALITLALSVMVVALLHAVETNSQTVLGAFAAMLTLIIAFALPMHVLPATALIVYAAVPAKLLPDATVVSIMPIGTALLIVWAVRRWIEAALSRDSSGESGTTRPSDLLAGVLAALFTLWAVLSAITHSTQLFGLGWLLSFAAALFIPLTVKSAGREARLMLNAWIIVGGIAGAYAVVELVIGDSPLFGPLYSLVGAELSQHWSVYRAEVSFSHPLFAGTFLAAATTLGIVTWFDGGKKSSLLWGILAAAGVIATLSRGSLIATIVAIAGGVLLVSVMGGHRSIARYLFLFLIATVAITVVTNLDAFNTRNNSVEAELSAGARDTGLDVALEAAASSNFLGTGPATSGRTASQFGTVVIENSYLQILISLGLPGVILFVAFLLRVGMTAIRRRRLAPASALLAVGIALAGFNGLDAVRSMHLVLGLAVFLALHLPTTTTLRQTSRERFQTRRPARNSTRVGIRS